MNHHRFIIALALIVAASAGASEREPVGPAAAGAWYHVGCYSDVRALCRVGDSLWVGTGGGVFVYDLGSDAFVDHVTIGARLPSNSVRALAARADTVYVGTDRGVSVFAPDSVLVFTPASPGPFAGAPLERIRRIEFGPDGRVYLSTDGFGLGVVGADTAWTITRADSLLDDKVYGMVQEDDTTFFFATSTGLCAYRDSAWVSFRAGAGIPRAEVRRIVPSDEAGFFLVVAGRGVYAFDGYRAKRVTPPDLFAENAVADVAVDADGALWACGSHGGIAVYRNGHWTPFVPPVAGEAARRWRAAASDSEGGVYLGSADGVVLALRGEAAFPIRLPPGLPGAGVAEMAVDAAGGLYALNDSYLLRFEQGPESFTVERASPVVVDVGVSPDGEVWTATRWGIYRREGERYVEMAARLPERDPVIAAIGFDSTGALWAGTQTGEVHRFDGALWMRMADAGELGLGAVRAIVADGSARLWVTGTGGRVAALVSGRWRLYGPDEWDGRGVRRLAVAPSGVPVLATESGLWGCDADGEWKAIVFDRAAGADSVAQFSWDPSSPGILTVGFDRDGRLYVGTEDGVATIDDRGMRWLTYRDGLGGRAVTSIAVTDGAYLWVGFRRDGLTRLPLSAFRRGPDRD